MDKELNPQDRPRVSTRTCSALAPLDKRGAPIAAHKEQSKTSKFPRMEPTQQAKVHSDAPRPSPGMIPPGMVWQKEKTKSPLQWALAKIPHMRLLFIYSEKERREFKTIQ
ncbi:hypothetical protein LIER_42766 [Lithospermum erythrorhizon]|uniref:Uncharacterized protein n=1 Tax=Lithospermum erythrorhizon TaxID=34254 RepID=A0AAV3NZX5_LITER